jgi:hypothetical protein
MSSGVLRDAPTIETFANFYGGTEEQCNAVYNEKHNMDPRLYQYPIASAKIIKIKKEVFIRLILSKNNFMTQKIA